MAVGRGSFEGRVQHEDRTNMTGQRTKRSALMFGFLAMLLLLPLAAVAPTASAQTTEEVFEQLETGCPEGPALASILRDEVLYCAARIAGTTCPAGTLQSVLDPSLCLLFEAARQPMPNGVTLPDFFTATDCEFYFVDEGYAGVPFRGKCFVLTPGGTLRSTPIIGSAGQFCYGERVTVLISAGSVPTSGDDVILGTSGPDVIAAGDGNDLICGGGGDDQIFGQGGNDVILGEDGDDKLRGGDERDVLLGGEGADDMNGGRDGDIVFGEGGDDSKVRGGTGDDVIAGDLGHDVLIAGNGGQDAVFGGSGDDALVTGGPRPDELYGNNGNDVLKGHKGADVLFGGSGDDDLRGGEQSDTLDGSFGVDTCNGGQQVDTGTECETYIGVENSTVATLPRTAAELVNAYAGRSGVVVEEEHTAAAALVELTGGISLKEYARG